jgi:PAS domain S-box-containing protein
MQMPAVSALVRDVTAAVRNASATPVNVYSESLERNRFTGDDARLVALLSQRYSTDKPDLVVAIAAPSVGFVIRHRADLFPGIPLIYSFIDARMALELRNEPGVSGVSVQSGFLELSDLALKLHPKARHVVVVSGTSEFDQGWEASYRRAAGPLEARASIEYLGGSGLPELLGELATLPDDSLILYLSLTRDGKGAVFVPRDVLAMIRRVSRVPIYAPSSTYMGVGAVGGPVMDLEQHGKAVGRMAARALGGEAVSAIKAETTPSVVVFDQRELNRFGISERLLPEGARILYRENSWSVNKGWILGLLTLVAAQTFLIIALVTQHRKRAALQRNLDARLTFGTLLSDVSTALNAVPLRSLDATIRSVLERLSQYFDVDKVAVLDTSVNPAVCRAHDGSPLAERALAAACVLVEGPFASLRLASYQPLTLSPATLPVDAARERALLEHAGVQSLGMVAMEVGGQLLGVLCCISESQRTEWTADAQQQLRTVAEVVASALQRQATAAAVSESDRLRGAVLSSLSAQISVLDRNGRIIAVNDAWTEFGRANGVRDEATISPGVNYLDVCRRAVADGAPAAGEALEGIQAVCDGRREQFVHDYSCDSPDQGRRFEMRVVPLRRPEGGVVVTHRDSTMERRHEAALRESEHRFRLLADTLPVGVWMAGPDGACIYVNRTWLEWTGRELEREQGDGWRERVHVEDLPRVTQAFSIGLSGQRPFSIEFRLQRADGRFRWVFQTVCPRRDDAGNVLGFVGGCIDITARFESQARLRELSGRLIHAQEEERRRVAAELHDDLQQRMALLAIELEGLSLGRPLGGREDVMTQARRLLKKTNEISSEMHRISHRLLPAKLKTLGLLSAVEGYCKEMAQQGLRVVFSNGGVTDAIPEDVALCVFRVLQEALQNVLKHAGTADAHVALSTAGGNLHLEVTDTGRDFEPDADLAGGGLGLLSMRERLRLVGGDITVLSATASGTKVLVLVPLAPEQRPASFPGTDDSSAQLAPAATDHCAALDDVRGAPLNGSPTRETP